MAPSVAHVESDNLQIAPYAQRPHVPSAVRRHGDNAAFHLPDRQVLTHHCALRNQWITVPGKMKQRYRLSHSATYEEFAHPAAKLWSRFNTSGSPCEHFGAVTKAPRQHPSKCTVLWQLCVLRLRNHGCGHPRVLRGPPAEIRRCRDEGGTCREHHTRSQSPQTGGRQRKRWTAQRSIAAYAASSGSTAERRSPCAGPLTSGEGAGQTGVAARMEAESAKGSRGSATAKCAHHVPARASAQAPGNMQEPLLNNVVEMLSRVIPLLGTPFMVNRFHANGGLKETNNKAVAFQLEICNRTPGCQDVWQVLEKLRGLSALQLIGGSGLYSTVTGHGCSSEAL